MYTRHNTQKPVTGIPLRPDRHWSKEGLVGCLLFNEGGGNTVFDLSGNGNTGTLNGGLYWDSSYISHPPGIFWPGDVGDYIELPTKGINANIGTVIIAYTRDSGGGGYLFGHQNGNNRLYLKGVAYEIAIADSSGLTLTNANTASDVSQVLAIVYDNNAWRAYQDGAFINSGTYNGSISSLASTWRIGDHNTDHSIWDGRIFYFYWWNRALSASEIAQLYREPFCMFWRDDIGLWKSEAAPTGNAGIMTCNTGFWGATF